MNTFGGGRSWLSTAKLLAGWAASVLVLLTGTLVSLVQSQSSGCTNYPFTISVSGIARDPNGYFSPEGGSGYVSWSKPTGGSIYCSSVISSNAAWLYLSSSGSTGTSGNSGLTMSANGPYSRTGTLTVRSGPYDSSSYSVRQNPTVPALQITSPSSLPSGTVGSSYGPVSFNATGGTGGYRWSASGLPSGLTISVEGVLAGTPAAGSQGSYNPQFTVRDSSNNTTSVTRSLTISSGSISISSLNPSSVKAGSQGFTLTVNGSGFGSGATVFWNGSALSTTVAGPSQLTASVSASRVASPGTATVTVGLGELTSNSATFTITLDVSITSLTPSSTTAGGPGFTLTVNGIGFDSSAVVRWNGSGLTTTFVGTNQLTASVPSDRIASPGTVNVTVSSGGVTSNALNFTIAGSPTISSLSPSSAVAGGPSFTLTVNGANFAAGSVVLWNGSALDTPPGSSTRLTATVSASLIATAGVATVQVSAGGVSSNSLSFTITRPRLDVFPSQLSFTHQIGTSPPESQNLSITSTSTNLSFSISASGGIWLSVNPSGGTTPSTVTVSVNPGSLAAGDYSATLTVGSSGKADPVTVGVSLRVTGSGISAPITANPESLIFSYVARSATPPSSQSISLSSGNETVTFQAAVSTGSSAWLAVSPASGSTPALLTVSVDTEDLPAGTYNGAISITGGAGPVSVPIKLTVSPPQTIHLTASPPGLTFAYPEPSASLAAPQSISVFTDIGSLQYSATASGGSWLQLSGAQGVTPGAVKVRTNPAGLSPGDYDGTIVIEAVGTSLSPVRIPVRLTIAAPQAPQLSLSPSEIRLALVQGGSRINRDVLVSNDGGSVLEFQAEARISSGSNSNWLTVATSSGSVDPRRTATVKVAIDPAAVSPGTYRGTINVSGSGQSARVPVILAVSPNGPSILLSQTGLEFTATSNVRPPEQRFAVVNNGQGSMPWQLETEVLTGGNWLSVSPASGNSPAGALSNPYVTVAVDAQGLAAGTYYGTVRATADGAANSPQTVAVVLRVAGGSAVPPPLPSVSGILFEVERGKGETQQQLSLQNLSDQTVEFSSNATTEQDTVWFTVPARSLIPPRSQLDLTLESKLAGLPAGAYRGSLRMAFPGGPVQTVEVQSIVTAATTGSGGKDERFANPNCSPTKLVPVITSPQLPPGFQVRAGSPVNIEVNVVDDCGNPVTEAAIVVKLPEPYRSIELVHRANGIWAGTWVPLTEGPRKVDLKLAALAFRIGRVLVPDNEVTRSGEVLPGTETIADTVLNSASFQQPREVALGSWVSIFGEGLADSTAINEATRFPLELGGTQVTLGGDALPLYYVSGTQINALIPSGLAPNTTHQLEVRRTAQQSVGLDVVVAENQPAIYAVNQQGTGQGAILTSDNALAAPAGMFPGSRPARRGETIQIYATGLGVVSNPPGLGEPAPLTPPLSETLRRPVVMVGGHQAAIQFSGLAPGFVGLYQINALVPEAVTPGSAVPVTMTLDEAVSNEVTIAVD